MGVIFYGNAGKNSKNIEFPCKFPVILNVSPSLSDFYISSSVELYSVYLFMQNEMRVEWLIARYNASLRLILHC